MGFDAAQVATTITRIPIAAWDPGKHSESPTAYAVLMDRDQLVAPDAGEFKGISPAVALIGVFLIFFYTNATFTRTAYIGTIMMAGIVVNNAIVLIDYIDILRDRDGMDRREALVQGGKTRFRPVILTAMTTALGLVPLAIGLNLDFFGLFRELNPDFYWGGDQASWWGSMAVAVIVGIMFATFLTLILVPVMYSLVDDGTAFFKKHFVARPQRSFGQFGRSQTGKRKQIG